MKNKNLWNPSKFEYRKGHLRASRDRNEVSVSSILLVDLIAQFYEKELSKHASGKLLDLGCGKVPLFLAYKKYVSENICVDWENSLHQNPFIDFNMDLNKPLLFNNEEFNTIILSDVLEHISRPEQLWDEMFRILKNEGKAILNVPFLYHIHEQPHDYFRYTQYALRTMAERAGFRIILLEEIGGLPEVFTDLFAKGTRHIPFIGSFISIVSQKFTYTLLSTKIGNKISKKTAKNFPLGYFMIVKKE